MKYIYNIKEGGVKTIFNENTLLPLSKFTFDDLTKMTPSTLLLRSKTIELAYMDWSMQDLLLKYLHVNCKACLER